MEAERDRRRKLNPMAGPLPFASPAARAEERLPWGWLAALAGGFAVAYAVAAPPVIGEGDAAEFTLALVFAGVPHPPGYPIYTLLGAGWVRLLHTAGFGWAHAANLWSAAGGAAAVLLTAGLADRLLPAGIALGRTARACVVAAAVALLGAHPVFARVTTQAEVYSWAVAWVAGGALAALTFQRRLACGQIADGTLRWGAVAWGVIAGAGLAHRPTTLAFSVPLTVLLVVSAARARRLDRWLLPAALAGAAIPLASLLHVAWRAWHPAPFQWPLLEPGIARVLEHVASRVYANYLGALLPRDEGHDLLVRHVVPVLAVAAAAAAWLLWRDRRAPDHGVLLALSTGAIAKLAFVSRYGVEDAVVFLLPVLLVASVLLARAAATLVDRLPDPLPASAGLAGAMMLVTLFWLGPEFARGGAIASRDAEVRAAFQALPFERGVVFWQSDSYVRLRAWQLLEGVKPGVAVFHPGMLTWPAPRREATRQLGFDPLEGLLLTSDADLARVAPHVAGLTDLPVADFDLWWRTRSAAPSATTAPR